MIFQLDSGRLSSRLFQLRALEGRKGELRLRNRPLGLHFDDDPNLGLDFKVYVQVNDDVEVKANRPTRAVQVLDSESQDEARKDDNGTHRR